MRVKLFTSCPQWREKLAAMHPEDLSDCGELQGHIAHCFACRNVYDDYRLMSSSLRQLYPTSPQPGLTMDMIEGSETFGSTVKVGLSRSDGETTHEKLLFADLEERQRVIEDYVCEKVLGVLGLPQFNLDRKQSLRSYGLNSFEVMRLRSCVAFDLGMEVPIAFFLQDPSVVQLSALLLEQFIRTVCAPLFFFHLVPGSVQDREEQGDEPVTGQLLERLDKLSDEEVDGLLDQILQEEADRDVVDGGAGRYITERLLLRLSQASDVEVDAFVGSLRRSSVYKVG